MNESEREGAVCVVLGCGPVGLCAITAAQKRFPTILAIDGVSDRLGKLILQSEIRQNSPR